MLTHNEPSAMVNPVLILPNCAQMITGKMISRVIRNPSAKYWLNRKYRRRWEVGCSIPDNRIAMYAGKNWMCECCMLRYYNCGRGQIFIALLPIHKKIVPGIAA